MHLKTTVNNLTLQIYSYPQKQRATNLKTICINNIKTASNKMFGKVYQKE